MKKILPFLIILIANVANSQTGYFVISKYNTSGQNSLSARTAGIIYNTDSSALCVYDGTAWRRLGVGINNWVRSTTPSTSRVYLTNTTDSAIIGGTVPYRRLTNYGKTWLGDSVFLKTTLVDSGNIRGLGQLLVVDTARFTTKIFQAGPTTTNNVGNIITRNAVSGEYEALSASSATKLHQIFTPLTGGTVNANSGYYNLINPAGTIATLTINLPGSPSDNDIVILKFTQAVTAITYSGGTIAGGGLTSATVGGEVFYIFDSGTGNWY